MNKEVTKLVKENIESLYNSLMEKPLQVLDIFNNFFGEDKVDMQGYLSLNEFESWINTAPIINYIRKEAVTGLSDSDWDSNKEKPITELSSDLIGRVIETFKKESVLDSVGSYKFNSIFILIHFPKVRVTNEHDKYVDIKHLWAKVKIFYNGTMNGGFTLNRSEYTLLHIRSGYMHSHISSIPTYDFTSFQTPCTGTGPINGTISSLNRDYDEDIWNMFCLELSKYVTVESLSGVPYNRLENLGTNDMVTGLDKFTAWVGCSAWGTLRGELIKDFVKYFIYSKELKFNYNNGSYSIGMSITEFITLISNKFIEWYNRKFNEGEVNITFQNLKRDGIIEECIIANGKIYYDRDMHIINDCSQYIGEKVCTFKGVDITVNITDVGEIRNDNKTIILAPRIALSILTKLLEVLNYRYGRNKAIHKGNTTSTEVRYL